MAPNPPRSSKDSDSNSGILDPVIKNLKERITVYKFVTTLAWQIIVKGVAMNKITALLKSTRFWMAVAGVVAVALKETLGLDETQTLAVAAIVVSWIVGETVRPNVPPTT